MLLIELPEMLLLIAPTEDGVLLFIAPADDVLLNATGGVLRLEPAYRKLLFPAKSVSSSPPLWYLRILLLLSLRLATPSADGALSDVLVDSGDDLKRLSSKYSSGQLRKYRTTLTGVTTSIAAMLISVGFPPGRRRLGPNIVARLFKVILFSEELAATLKQENKLFSDNLQSLPNLVINEPPKMLEEKHSCLEIDGGQSMKQG